MNPVGRPITGASKAGFLNKSFQEEGLITISGFPVFGQTFSNGSQYFRSEVVNSNPGKNKKSCVVNNQVEIICTVFGGPPDKVIPWRGFPGCCSKTKICQEMSSGKDQISHLCAG